MTAETTPSTAERVRTLKASIEEQFISGTPATSADIYFELASIVTAGTVVSIEHTTELDSFVDVSDRVKALAEARATLTYKIGCRAAFADFHTGNNDRLQNLVDIVNQQRRA